MSQLAAVKNLFLSDDLRAALNLALAAEGLRQVSVPTVAHRELLSLVSYAPNLPALAVELSGAQGQRLSADEDYRQTVDVTAALAYAHSTEASARSDGVRYADCLRAVLMTAALGWCDAGTAGLRTARYVRTAPEGEPFANDAGVVCRRVDVSLRVQFDGIATEV